MARQLNINYLVHFYVENDTHSFSLGSALTDSSGLATKTWDTSGYAQGIYYPKCNLTTNSSLYYNASETNQANTTINLTQPLGMLEVKLVKPPVVGITQVGQNKTFILNATVYCREGNCGNVEGTVRYNSSSLYPDTPISTLQGDEPFWTDTNPKACPSNPLEEDEFCNLTWEINATGDLHTFWKVGVLFQASSASNNHTKNATVEIAIVLIINLTDHLISSYYLNPDCTGQIISALSPNTTGACASNNPINITVDENSNDAAGLYIKGTDLNDTNYQIHVSNITWCTILNYDTCSQEHRLSHEYQEIISPAPAGTNQPVYYWVDVPLGIAAQSYNGTIYIMANATD